MPKFHVGLLYNLYQKFILTWSWTKSQISYNQLFLQELCPCETYILLFEIALKTLSHHHYSLDCYKFFIILLKFYMEKVLKDF